MSYFTKLMRIPSHHFDPPVQKQRSRSLDVEALERSGIKMLRVVMTSQVSAFDKLTNESYFFFRGQLNSTSSSSQLKVSTFLRNFFFELNSQKKSSIATPSLVEWSFTVGCEGMRIKSYRFSFTAVVNDAQN